MENLIFSLNSTLPIFLVMVVGYLLGQIGFLPRSFCAVADKLVFRVTLPVMLFCDMAELDLKNDFEPKYVLFCAAATTAAILGIWLLAHCLLPHKDMVGEFVQGCYRSSAAILGVAFIRNIYGSAGMAPLMILGSVPLFNIFAVIVLTVECPGQVGPVAPRKVLRDIAANPILIGLVLGILYSLLPFGLPAVALKTMGSLSDLTAPLALLSIGACFEGRRAIKKLGPTLVATACKLVLLVALFLPAALALGFRDQQLVALLVMLGSPTTPTSYIMAKNMGHEGVLSASVVASTTLLSALSLTGWIFLLRSLGVIC